MSDADIQPEPDNYHYHHHYHHHRLHHYHHNILDQLLLLLLLFTTTDKNKYVNIHCSNKSMQLLNIQLSTHTRTRSNGHSPRHLRYLTHIHSLTHSHRHIRDSNICAGINMHVKYSQRER